MKHWPHIINSGYVNNEQEPKENSNVNDDIAGLSNTDHIS
jgi:hypothetical protein